MNIAYALMRITDVVVGGCIGYVIGYFVWR